MSLSAALASESERVRLSRVSLRDRLLVLRRFLPQYSLAGLWKGNYPNHGDELVRLHYSGETLFGARARRPSFPCLLAFFLGLLRSHLHVSLRDSPPQRPR